MKDFNLELSVTIGVGMAIGHCIILLINTFINLGNKYAARKES